MPGKAAALTSTADHLVVAAASLAEGVAWCEKTLGVTPGAGGEHPLMGTHNRLINVSSADYPASYLEIIAIHSGAPCARPARARRWFDLENPVLQNTLRASGPQLIHFVARTTQAAAGVQALALLGLDRGPLLPASRMTPEGLLAWQISVRDDGQRLLNGTLPTLIQWEGMHPTWNMAASGVTLQSLQACHPQAGLLSAAYQAIGLAGVGVSQGTARLVATLQTPCGLLTLASGPAHL